ncbi:hypothetical protein AKN87_01830 [Thiopseudomonas alkaliphila]|uniref:Head-tail adaptor n=2 Tax=Thiopseudomonas alkaliphila TaxID=1697053 RepID=A0A0K1XGK9_9GAMM|nr:phage head closure protein [Thiopseudomonas alkaliphila]AKX43987.1 hypothetical protein AKN87_01830 [Thiopseudomonas alkaliphila]AKX52032.1 hypothetical protein AKN92_11515 [Thiopseudomonas alkaliphila]AKX60471.1 hypothetical protein AKN88_11440 [Thiopseudomonas alkaliphila]
MRAGRLKHRVMIQKQVRQQDPETGAMNLSWKNWKSLWASIEHLSVKDSFAAQAAGAETVARVVIRAGPKIEPGGRIIHGDHVFSVIGAIPDAISGSRYLTILVKEHT